MSLFDDRIRKQTYINRHTFVMTFIPLNAVAPASGSEPKPNEPGEHVLINSFQDPNILWGVEGEPARKLRQALGVSFVWCHVLLENASRPDVRDSTPEPWRDCVSESRSTSWCKRFPLWTSSASRKSGSLRRPWIGWYSSRRKCMKRPTVKFLLLATIPSSTSLRPLVRVKNCSQR